MRRFAYRWIGERLVKATSPNPCVWQIFEAVSKVSAAPDDNELCVSGQLWSQRRSVPRANVQVGGEHLVSLVWRCRRPLVPR